MDTDNQSDIFAIACLLW